MLDEDSLSRLRCPVSFGKLTLADEGLIARVNQAIDARGVPTRGGEPRREPVQSGLVTADRCHLYPIQDGIICMLAESAIDLTSVDVESSGPQSGDPQSGDESEP